MPVMEMSHNNQCDIDLKFKNICSLSEAKETHLLSLKFLFITLRSHTKGMHYDTFQ